MFCACRAPEYIEREKERNRNKKVVESEKRNRKNRKNRKSIKNT